MNVQEIKELLSAFSESDAGLMELEMSDVRLVLKKEQAFDAEDLAGRAKKVPETTGETEKASESTDAAGGQKQPSAEAETDLSQNTSSTQENFTAVKAPIAGIFYRSASPEAAPYVMAGQEVKKGDVIGLIEAMKVMNEIPAPCDGVIESILIENETFVGYDQVLMEIR